MPKQKRKDTQPKLKLYYFDTVGKGEPIRLLCAYANLELEDYRFESREVFQEMRDNGEFPFGQVPLLDPAEGNDPRVSPLRAADLSGLPPALVVTAEYDPLLDDGRLYAEKLRAAGTPVTYSQYPGATHAFYWMQGIANCAKRLHQEIAAWVRAVHNQHIWA